MSDKKRVGVRLDESLIERADRIADRLYTTRTEVIVRALVEFLDEQERQAQERQAQLIGEARDAYHPEHILQSLLSLGILQRDDDAWDRKIAEDVEAGRMDALFDEVIREREAEETQPLFSLFDEAEVETKEEDA